MVHRLFLHSLLLTVVVAQAPLFDGKLATPIEAPNYDVAGLRALDGRRRRKRGEPPVKPPLRPPTAPPSRQKATPRPSPKKTTVKTTLQPSQVVTDAPTPAIGGRIICGPSGAVRVATVDRYYFLASTWTGAFSDVCLQNSFVVTNANTDDAAAASLCAVNNGLADVAFLTRPLTVANEAKTTDGVNYQCNEGDTTRTAIQIPVAVDAAVLFAQLSGSVANCIASLPGGGLTFDQLRWIFSSYSAKQLQATGWSPSALPNSDNSDSTHYLSELCQVGTSCSASCPQQEINLVGPSLDSDLVVFLVSKILKDTAHGESIDAKRYKSTAEGNIASNVSSDPNALGLEDFALFDSNKSYAVSLQNSESNYFFPCKGSLKNGLYPLARNIYMDVRSDDPTTLAQLEPFVKYILSQTGDFSLSENGFIPLSNSAKVISYSRLGTDGRRRLVRNRQLSPLVTCGPSGPIAVAVAGEIPALFSLAGAWANVYSTFCPGSSITATKSNDAVAAAQICGDASKGPIVAVAMMTTRIKSSDAAIQSNGFTFKCLKDPGRRLVNEVIVATSGTITKYLVDPNGVASSCIDSLGALSLDQLRWMFSSFTTSQLVATGWNKESLPNSDGDDSTHLWSELSAKCAAKEIRIAGPPTTASSFALFSNVVFRGIGETVALNRPLGYFSGQDQACPKGNPEGNPDVVTQYLNRFSDAIGLVEFTQDLSRLLDFNVNARVLNEVRQDATVPAPIFDAKGQAVSANASSLSDCTYPVCQQLFAYVSRATTSFQKSAPWLVFGYSSLGDSVVASVGLNPIPSATKTDYRNNRLKPCFSEAVTVKVMGKGTISIKDLVVGDLVMNHEGKFDRVYSLAHYDPLVPTEFLQIHVIGGEKPLEITPPHMLFVGETAIPASAVRVGDNLTLALGGVVQVSRVNMVIRRGAFAPFTMSGTIAVNSVAASVYEDLHHGGGVLVVGGHPLTVQFVEHMFQAPHRLLCRINFVLCQREENDDHGVSKFVAARRGALEWLMHQNDVVNTTIFIPWFLVGLLFYAVEMLIINKVCLLAVVASSILYRIQLKVK